MISIVTSRKPLESQEVDGLAVFLTEGFSVENDLGALASSYFPALKELIAQKEFTGKSLSSLIVTGFKQNKAIDLIFVGLGKASDNGSIETEIYRRAVGRVIRIAETRKIESLALQLPQASLLECGEYAAGYEAAIIVRMAKYHFDSYITSDDRKFTHLKNVILVATQGDESTIKKAVHDGEIVAQSVNQARHWIDLPPILLTPEYLARQAQDIAKKNNLKVTVFSEEEVIKMGMGGLAGVSRGSDLDCKFVILEYNCGIADAPTLGIVGKGITFDSGGLSIKPAESMERMKDDMSGAAAVISTMDALAQLKPAVNVIAFAPIAENLPSGKALRPGDIISFYNGKTAEVKNTDAEGRLILADALSYAVKNYKLDAIIDLATLTGACAYFLGPFFSGLLSQHEEFTKRVQEAGEKSGDRVWRLPLHDDYKPAIQTAVADICNIGSSRYKAGAITAAFFLQNFVDDVPWVHLDIAGTAFDVPDISYFRSESATGVGVRLLVNLAMNWEK
jgi:leucyl aminopeptidase